MIDIAEAAGAQSLAVVAGTVVDVVAFAGSAVDEVAVPIIALSNMFCTRSPTL